MDNFFGEYGCGSKNEAAKSKKETAKTSVSTTTPTSSVSLSMDNSSI